MYTVIPNGVTLFPLHLAFIFPSAEHEVFYVQIENVHKKREGGKLPYQQERDMIITTQM